MFSCNKFHVTSPPSAIENKKTLNQNVSKFTTALQHAIAWSYFPDFSPGEEIVWLAEAKKFRHNRWTQDKVKLLQFPHFFSPAGPSTAPTHGYFVLSTVSLASRNQDGGPSDSAIDIYDLTENW